MRWAAFLADAVEIADHLLRLLEMLIVVQMVADSDAVARNQTFRANDCSYDLVTLTNNTGLADAVVADSDDRWADSATLIVFELDSEFVANRDSTHPLYLQCPCCMGCTVG